MRLWRSGLLLAALLSMSGCKWAFEQVASRLFHVDRYDNGQPKKEGWLLDGKQDGKWTFRYADGRKRAEGEYTGDHQTGAWTSWYENGHVEWTGRFDARGARTGAWTFHHDNGVLRATGWFAQDLEQGHWVFFDRDGRLQRTGDFLDARQVGWWSERRDGTVQAEGLSFDGQRVGPWTRRQDGVHVAEVHAVPDGCQLVRDTWPGGALRRTGLTRAGQPVGGWTTFHRDGSPRLFAVFADGTARTFFACRPGDAIATPCAGMLAGNELTEWIAPKGGATASAQDRMPLPQVPLDTEWSADDLADRQPPERLAGTWLAELRAPATAVAAPSPAPAPGDAPAAATAGPPRLVPPRLPEWTVLEQKELDQHVQEYLVGRPAAAAAASASRYAIPLAMQGKPRRRSDLEGWPLPIDQLRATDGSVVRLADYHGKRRVLLVVLRGFFGQVCVYCVAQTEALAQCHDRFDALNMEVLILYPGPEGNEQAFLDAYRETFGHGAPPYRVFYDPDLRIVKQLGIEGGDLAYPTTLFVDTDGTVRYAYTGAHRADRPAADELLKFVTNLDRK